MAKIALLNFYRKNFSYVFLRRTLYLLRLDIESNGRAVRA